MACPSCGSTAYTLIGPGVAQCQGTLALPTGAHPSGAAGPTTRYGVCGLRYQVTTGGSALGMCECGMQAIARCAKCGKPLCLDHSARADGRILCYDDYRAEATARSQVAEKELADAWQAFAGALTSAKARGLHAPADHVGQHRLAG